MKRYSLLHLLWLGIAAGAYFLGTQRSDQLDATASSHPGNTSAAVSQVGSPAAKTRSNEKGEQIQAGHSSTSGALSATGASPVGWSSTLSLPDLVKEAISSNPVKRSKAIAELLGSLNTENAPQILGAMHEGGASPEQMGMFVYAWGAQDGAAAMAFADEIAEHMDDEERFGYKSQVVKGWASSDPASARDWIDEQAGQKELVENPKLAEELLGGYRWNLVAGMADGSIDVATAYAIERAEADDRAAPKYMDMITERKLEQSSVGDSVDWAEGLPDGGLKASALRRVATDFVDENPEGAAAWASTMASDEHGARVIHEVGDEWAERDAPAAVAWLETLPDGEAKSAGMSAALAEWVKRGDPMEASQYLATMPQSPARDQAVGGFTEVLARTDPESAVQWAETIQQDGIRQEALVGAGRAWMRRDPVKAAEWLQGGSVSEQAVEEIVSGAVERDWNER